jgi:competence protein ComEC
MKILLPFVGGILAGWEWIFSVWYIGVIVLMLALLLAALVAQREMTASAIEPLVLVLLMFFVGVLKITLDQRGEYTQDVSQHISPGKTVQLYGSVADIPKRSQRSIRFILDADSVSIDGLVRPVKGGVLASISMDETATLAGLGEGSRMMVFGELTQPGEARNPGDFDLRRYLRVNGIYARFFVRSANDVEIISEADGALMHKYVAPVRRAIATRLDQYIGNEESKFLKALIIGDRSEIPDDVKASFVNAGVIHVMAVSGLHVGMITIVIITLLQVLRIPEKPRIVATAAILCYYILLTGGAPSVVRAVVMAIVYLASQVLERQRDAYNVLAVAALVLLFIDAKQLFMPGFQLSFAAVASLAYLGPKFYRMHELLPESVRDSSPTRLFIGLLAISLAAGIGTLPFVSFYFGKISIVSLLANILIVPLTGILLPLGMATVAISFLSGWIASCYAAAASTLAWCILWLVQYFGNLPYAYVDSHFTAWTSIGYYAAVAVALQLPRWEARPIVLVMLLVGANIFVYGSIIGGNRSAALRVTFLDVGQGDAAFVELPGGRNMLVDAGPRTWTSDAGARFIEPFLKLKGVKRIDAILTSHPHSDHLGGVPYLMRRFDVGEVIDAGSRATSSLFQEYLHLSDSLDIRRVIAQVGTPFDQSAHYRLYLIHPSGEFAPRDSVSRPNLNDESLVVKVMYGSTSLLFSGDAEAESEAQMASVFGAFLRSDVLKVGHHGSITSSTEEYLDAIQPRYAIISVGARNKFKHPSPVILHRLAERGVSTYRTDAVGAVVLESDGQSWRISDWR